ncbi:hypothetical protein AcV5_002882 [Taiwanofungus camphoratus]|nr:hypothetical protein AcV5_002882 [Antrodia cinnamomea]
MNIASANHINAELNPNDQPALMVNEVQTGKYMNELLSHGVQLHAAGCKVRGTKVTIWYDDRMAIAQSKPFDRRKVSRLLLLVLAPMESADHARVGACPFFKFPMSAYDTHADVKLDIDDDVATDVDDKTLEIDDNQSVYTSYEVVGRGTTIVPIKATGVTKVMFGEDGLMAKLAWPSMERGAEDNFIKKIRRRLKGSHALVAQADYSLTGVLLSGD